MIWSDCQDVDRHVGKKGDIPTKDPESGTFTVDWIGLELGLFLDRLTPVSGQDVDRQA